MPLRPEATNARWSPTATSVLWAVGGGFTLTVPAWQRPIFLGAGPLISPLF